jgi:type IV pilus assembly protein PilE
MQTERKGFTLVELLIIITIIAILASIAIPSYRDYVMRARLTEPQSELSAQRVRIEQYFQDVRTYEGACTAGTVAPPIPDTTFWTYTCDPAPTASTYLIGATGRGAMAGFAFDVDQSNTRRTVSVPSGWTRPSGNCWVTKKGGQC